jgi:single-stranded DNA-binding protein
MSDLQIRYNVLAPTGFEIKVSGNLGKDPEVRDVNNTRVIKFSLAASAGRKKVDDNWENQTQWITINIWENVPGADKVFAFIDPDQEWMKIKKGAQFSIEGYVIQSSRVYEGKSYIEYDVREVTKFNKPPMSPKKSDDGANGASSNEELPSASDNF